MLFLKIVSVILLILLAMNLAGDVFKRQVEQNERKKIAMQNATGTSFYANEIIGIAFSYPAKWGKIKLDENVTLNYLLPLSAPDELGTIFEKKGLGSAYLAAFRKMDSAKQLSMLKSDREYEKFLSKEATITFSKNPNIRISAFNKYALNISGYEAAVANYPFYTGDKEISQALCQDRKFLNRLTLEKTAGCYASLGKFLQIKGVSFADVMLNTNSYLGQRNGASMAVSNLKSKQYSGLILHYANKKYEASPAPEQLLSDMQADPRFTEFQIFLQNFEIK